MIHPRIAERLAKQLLHVKRTSGKGAAMLFCSYMTDHLPADDQAVIRNFVHAHKT